MSPLIELAEVHKAFGNVVVADGLSFSVEEGEAVGVVGPNGAGKTSTLNLISGAIPLDRGVITLEGRDITSAPAHVRARLGIGRTFQVPQPFAGLTVFENVLLAATFGAGARMGGRDAVDLSVDCLSDTGLGAQANTIAGGLPLMDRKRLELARALATRPKLLLLDEIGGGLTEVELRALVDQIRTLKARGIGIIWIEHLVHALVNVVDRLIAMDFGRIVAEGQPREVMADARVQAVYLGQEMELPVP